MNLNLIERIRYVSHHPQLDLNEYQIPPDEKYYTEHLKYMKYVFGFKVEVSFEWIFVRTEMRKEDKEAEINYNMEAYKREFERRDKESIEKLKIELIKATEVYKIHLMPDNIKIFFGKFFKFLNKHQKYFHLFKGFKFKLKGMKEFITCKNEYEWRYKKEHEEQNLDEYMEEIQNSGGWLCDYLFSDDYMHKGEVIPKVVIYMKGKDSANLMLKLLYDFFGENEPCQKGNDGECVVPRSNAKVTDLIWIAQSHGDYKSYLRNGVYSKPGWVYFSKEFADLIGVEQESFFLTHPKTGEYILDQ